MIEFTDLVQGTESWLNHRNNHIGASDAAVLMDCGYMTPFKLYQSKLGLYSTPLNSAMKRGNDLEPEARALYCKENNIEIEPLCAVSEKFPFMAASFDGISKDRQTLVEIKTGGLKTLEKILQDKIPDGHYAQCQHQLEVAGLTEMDYVFYTGESIITLKITRNDAYINKLIKKEKEFWDKVLSFNPPDLTVDDYEEVRDAHHMQAIEEYREAQIALSRAEEIAQEAKDRVINLCEGRSMQYDNFLIRQQKRKGSVDYSKVEALKGVDLEPFRKAPTTFWTIRSK